MTEFEKALRDLREHTSTALLGARTGERVAVVQIEVRHAVLNEVLGLYLGHEKIAETEG